MEETFEKNVQQLRSFGLLSESDLGILEVVDKACNELLVPEYEAYIERRFNTNLVPSLSKFGVMGLPIAAEYGGSGVSMLVHALAMERFGQLGMGVVTLLDVHQFLGSRTIQQFGSEEQKAAILPQAAKGDAVLAYALTEPEAGSDPSSMTARFATTSSGYVLNGQKYLISNGSIARYLVTFAKSEDDGKVSAFIVDSKTEGFRVAMHLSEKLGLFTSDTAELEFENMAVPKDSVLGRPGKGLSIAYSALLNGRIGIASGCLGVMEDCLIGCIERVKSRIQHGKPIGRHQLVQRHLARIATDLESSKWPVYMAAIMKDRLGSETRNAELLRDMDRQSAAAKLIASNSAFDAADRSVQLFGGFGYSILSPVGKHLIDSRVARIYEGTDEIMELKVASSILGQDYEAYR